MGLVIAVYVFAQLLVAFVPIRRGFGGYYINLTLLLLLASSLGLAIGFSLRSAIRRLLRESLNRRGIPICVDCCYDLRGQVELRCPECGKPFEENLLEGRPPR